ncbi:Zinc finger protein 42 [Hondaea fermentalgiana]|uniref:Zinc finger protein 42 n=1 Tax=Hondaea fermentalgiana TaxID=2315210 RepID=A0A2R5GPX3_9STRA|nr:Zinc finger protein 42 [Hondaea fermentalgiana]|eukprot:GBG30673.1 Zinc finger protein 42 [Hondaea fermentalgiana]
MMQQQQQRAQPAAAARIASTTSTMSTSSNAAGAAPDLACEFCGKVLATSKLLREHVAQHKWGPHEVIHRTDGRTVFRCLFEGCGKVVKDRKVLRKHLLTHKPREFVCPVPGCGKRFYERAKLKRHNLVHTGEKDFVCTYPGCDKKFAYKANLKTHIRTHTGHRPYACTYPGCNKSFAQASNRNSHMLTHNHSKSKRKVPDSSLSSPSSQIHNTYGAPNSAYTHQLRLTAADVADAPSRQGNTVLATAQALLHLPPHKVRKINDASSPQDDAVSATASPESERPAVAQAPVSPLLVARQAPDARAFLEASTAPNSFSNNNNNNKATATVPAHLKQTETVRSLLSLSGGGPSPSMLSESTAPRKLVGPSSLDKMADLVQLTSQKNKLPTPNAATSSVKKMPLRQHSSHHSNQPRVSIPALPRVPDATASPSMAPSSTPKLSPSFFDDFMAQLKMSSSPKSPAEDFTPAASPLAHLFSPSAYENHLYAPPVFPSGSVSNLLASTSGGNTLSASSGLGSNASTAEPSFMQQLMKKALM